jgi:hypothetical protein
MDFSSILVIQAGLFSRPLQFQKFLSQRSPITRRSLVPSFFGNQDKGSMTLHNLVSRANAVFAFAFSCLALATVGCFLSTAMHHPRPEVTIAVNDPAV